MAFKFVLYFITLILFVTAISYSDSGVSASIRVSAFVEQPLGLSYFPSIELESQEIENSFSGIESNPENQLFLRIPDKKSAVCIIETMDGKQLQYSVSKDLLPVAKINGESDFIPTINQITIIYTEN